MSAMGKDIAKASIVINEWYRESTSEWVYRVLVQGDDFNAEIRYAGKRKEDAMDLLKKRIGSDLMEECLRKGN